MIPVSAPSFSGREAELALDAIQSGEISGTSGKYIKEFEHRFSDYCGCRYGVAVNSGTSALHLAAIACGITKGDEVLVSAFTNAATAFAVALQGGIVVPVDSERDTWNMDTTLLERLVTKRTKAIMPVHIYGHPVEMGEVMRVARKHHLQVIEDCAEAHGATYYGSRVGSLGDVGCFSFYANKIITCFPGDTSILIQPPKGKRGLSRMRRIDQISIGDTVLSYDEKTAEKTYRTVIDVQRRSATQLVCLTFSNGNKIRATSEHPIYVVGRGWVDAGCLAIGDPVIQYRYRGMTNSKSRIVWKGKKRPGHSAALAVAHAEGKYETEAYRARGPKISKAVKGRLWDQERKDLQKEILRKFWENNSEARLRWSLTSQEVAQRPGQRERRVTAALKNGQDPAYRKKLSDGVRRAMQNDSYWENYRKGLAVKKNRAEARLEQILEQVVPGEFAFNGDGSRNVRIGNYIPDFVHIGDKKKVIELFGVRWHKLEEVEWKSKVYAEHGYESLFIWDRELGNECLRAMVAEKIMAYSCNPNVDVVTVASVEFEEFAGDVFNLTVEDTHTYFARGILVHNCGEGGMVVTNNRDLAHRCEYLRNLAFGTPRFFHEEVGFNYRMTNVQAAIGIAQLDEIESHIEGKRWLAARYTERLSGVAGIQVPVERDHVESVYWMYAIVVDPDEFGMARDELMTQLHEFGVETRTMFCPMNLQPALLKHGAVRNGTCPVAESLWKNGLYLPSGPLSEKEIDTICKFIGEVAISCL